MAVQLSGCSTKKVGKSLVPNSKKVTSHKASSLNKNFKYKKFESLLNNQRNYLIDLDGDSVDELITLRDSYSGPKFFTYNSKSREYDPLKIKGEMIRTSFLRLDSVRSTAKKIVLGMATYYTNDFMPSSGVGFFNVMKYGDYVELSPLNQVNADKKLPTTAIEQVDLQNEGMPMNFYFHWLVNDDGFYRPVVDQVAINGKLKNLVLETKERANYGSSLCDIDGDNEIEILISSTSDDPLEYIDYDRKNNKFFKEPALDDKGSGIFSSCFYEPYKQTPLFLIGKLHRNYESEKKVSGVYDPSGEVLFDFNLPSNSQVNNIITTDLNGDIYPDFIVENTGHPPKTKLEIFLSEKNGAYTKQKGINVVNPSGVIVGDINNDGKVDIIFGRSKKRASGIKGLGGGLINKTIYGKNKAIRFHFGGFKKFFSAVGGVLIINTKRGPIKRIINYSSGGLPSQSSRFIQVGLGDSYVNSIELFINGKKYKYKRPKLYSGVNIITLCKKEGLKTKKATCQN